MSHRAIAIQWPSVSLEDVAKVQTGLPIGKVVNGNSLKLPYLRVANVQDGYLELSEVKEVIVSANDAERFRLQHEDVLMTEGGDFDKLGRGCVWNSEIANCLHQNHVFAVRTNREKLLPYFFANYAASPIGRSYFLGCSKQSTNLASINSTQLRQMPVPLPPLPEQRAIAAVLSAWDRAIEQTTALIAAKERLKQGLMQQLLTGKRRFKEFTKPWEKKSFSAFMTESRVRGSNGDEARKLTVKLYGKGVVAKSEARVGSQATQYYRRSTGQFIYSKLDFLNGAFGIVPSVLDGYESTLDVPAFDIIEKMDSRWFVAFVSREAFYENHLGLANGGRKARRVNPNDFLAINVPIPENDEQAKIADAVDTFDREIKLLRQVLLATRVQKRALMQKLLTGEVRVTESLLKQGAKL